MPVGAKKRLLAGLPAFMQDESVGDNGITAKPTFATIFERKSSYDAKHRIHRCS
jgi:hypothetical protein